MERNRAGPKTQAIVNDCYILHHRLKEDTFAEYWHATAIFSAQGFLLRFLKDQGAESLWEGFYAQALASIDLRHPSLLPSLEIERFQGQIYLASDSSGVECLTELLKAGMKFPLVHICVFGVELAQALAAWEERTGPYTLLTPDAVWLRVLGGQTQEIRLLSPGYGALVSLLDPEGSPEYLLAHQAFLAPEVKAKESIDHRADIYALGVLLFHLLTGSVPFPQPAKSKDTAASVLYVVTKLRFHGVPDSIILILAKMLRKSPKSRYETWQGVIDDLSLRIRELQSLALRSGRNDPLLAQAGFATPFQTSGLSLEVFSEEQAQLPFPSESSAGPPSWEVILEESYSDDNETLTEQDILTFAARTDLWNPTSDTRADWSRERSVKPTSPPRPAKVVKVVPKPSRKEDDLQIRAYASPAVPASETSPQKQPWFAEAGSATTVLDRLTQDWRKAAVNHGSLRFVEEPRQDGPIPSFLAGLREKALYLELPDLVVQGDESDLLDFLESGWERAGSDRSPTYLKRLRQRIREARKSASKLSRVEEALSTLSILGTRATPLVLILHHSQNLSRKLHDLLLTLRSRGKGSSFCVFAFFEAGETPEWHVLRQLVKPKG